MNIKRIALGGFCLLTAVSIFAVPARKGARVFTRPDGSKIELRLIGDEFFHTYATVDGKAVGKGADGEFYYRSAEGLTDVRVSNIEERTEAERAFLESDSRVSVSSLVESLAPRVEARRKSASATGKKKEQKRQVPGLGSPKIPVILVDFADYSFRDEDPNKTFTEFFRTGEVSAAKYFKDQSNGKFTPEFDVYGPYKMLNNRITFGGNYNGEDVGVGFMVAQGCFSANVDIDYSKYDNDGDGECDVVIVLYAGDGESSSIAEDAEDAIWPCQWALSVSDYGTALKLDGVTVEKFAVFNELHGLDLSKIDGIGTFCHEFSHCIDLPDFYDTKYGPHFGMADWSVLDYGCYNNDGYLPLGYSAYEKEFMGWLDIEEAKENTFYTLPVFNAGSEETDKAIKLSNPQDPNEYFILENRARQGWDKYMPAEGLFIYHVTYDDTAWEYNVVNNFDMQRMTPVPADNSLKMYTEVIDGIEYWDVDRDDLVGDLWPYNGNNKLTDTTKPATVLNNGTTKTLGKPVTDIKRNEDGTISFWVKDIAGIDFVGAGASEAEYFNLQGVRMDGRDLAPGIYLERRGTETKKIIVK